MWNGFQLAEWIVKPEDGSLSSSATTGRLEPLLMELLVYLCSRAHQVVPKQDVLDAVWGGRFVSDETVKGSFYQLRKALGDNPRQPRFLETLPKRGYRVLIDPLPLAQGTDSGQSEAQELYLKGRQELAGQPSPESLKQARLYFERSLQSHADNAAALSCLAQTYILMVIVGAGHGRELLPRAKAAASRAAELDPKLAESHISLGAVRFVHDHDFRAADNEFRTAIELNPRDSTAHRWYARFLSSQNRHAEAIAEARRALEADPLSLLPRRDLVEVLFIARRYEDAIGEAQQLFDIAPHAADVHLGMVWVYHLHGQDRDAMAAFKSGLKSLGVSPAMLEQAQDAFDRGGLTAVMRLWLRVVESQAALGQKNLVDGIVLTALLGENDRCFELLELALEEGHPSVLWLPVSPIFDGLRSDPRYLPLVARLGFSQPFPNQ